MMFSYELEFRIKHIGNQLKQLTTLQNLDYAKKGLPYRLECFDDEIDYFDRNVYHRVMITGIGKVFDSDELRGYMPLFFDEYDAIVENSKCFDGFEELTDEEVVENYEALVGQINANWFIANPKIDFMDAIKVLYIDCGLEKCLTKEILEFYYYFVELYYDFVELFGRTRLSGILK